VNNLQLIEKARSVARPRELSSESTCGDVGCALVTDKGTSFVGVCIDCACGIGFCAEHSAIAAMVTAGESRISRIVAVTHDGKILPPCGRCREFMVQVNRANLKTEVILHRDRSCKLEELLPYPWQV